MGIITWCGWTQFESDYPYPDIRSIGNCGDGGQAYGMYQADYEYDLVPFMSFCRQQAGSPLYDEFLPYIAMGVGNEQLVNNTGLKNLYMMYATDYTDNFLSMQNAWYIRTYLNPAIELARQQGIPYLDNYYVQASLGSFALREGAYMDSRFGSCLRAMAQHTDTVENMLYYGYKVLDDYYITQQDDRWLARQYPKCINDMHNNLWLRDIGGETPEPPQPKKSSNFWRMFYNYILPNQFL